MLVSAIRKQPEMPYQVFSDNEKKILTVTLEPSIDVAEFIEINARINTYVREKGDGITLIVDANNVRLMPYSIERIRESQSYLESRDIARIIIISKNKVNRLTMLLLFNLCRPPLTFCDTLEQAQQMRRMEGG